MRWYSVAGESPRPRRGFFRRHDPGSDQDTVADALVRAAEALIGEHGSGGLRAREPGLERPVDRSWTSAEMVEILGELMRCLPEGLYDGTHVSPEAAVELVRSYVAGGPLWCSLEYPHRLVIQVGEQASDFGAMIYSLLVGCELSEVDMVRIVGPLGLTVGAGQVPSWWSDPRLPSADGAFWERLSAAVVAVGEPVPLVYQPAMHVEEWQLVDASNVADVRATIPPGTMVLLCGSPLLDRADPRLHASLETARERLNRHWHLRCVRREAATGRISSLPIGDEDELATWWAAITPADRAAIYPCPPGTLWPNDCITAATPDPEGLLDTRWRLTF